MFLRARPLQAQCHCRQSRSEHRFNDARTKCRARSEACVQSPKDSRQRSAENKRYLVEPELVLNTECFGVELAEVRHQLVFERFEVFAKSRALCLRIRRNDVLAWRRRPSQRWQSFKQSHEILLLPAEHSVQLNFQCHSSILDMK